MQSSGNTRDNCNGLWLRRQSEIDWCNHLEIPEIIATLHHPLNTAMVQSSGNTRDNCNSRSSYSPIPGIWCNHLEIPEIIATDYEDEFSPVMGGNYLAIPEIIATEIVATRALPYPVQSSGNTRDNCN